MTYAALVGVVVAVLLRIGILVEQGSILRSRTHLIAGRIASGKVVSYSEDVRYLDDLDLISLGCNFAIILLCLGVMAGSLVWHGKDVVCRLCLVVLTFLLLLLSLVQI